MGTQASKKNTACNKSAPCDKALYVELAITAAFAATSALPGAKPVWARHRSPGAFNRNWPLPRTSHCDALSQSLSTTSLPSAALSTPRHLPPATFTIWPPACRLNSSRPSPEATAPAQVSKTTAAPSVALLPEITRARHYIPRGLGGAKRSNDKQTPSSTLTQNSCFAVIPLTTIKAEASAPKAARSFFRAWLPFVVRPETHNAKREIPKSRNTDDICLQR